MVAGKQPDQQWNAADAGQRDGVGQIHRGHGPPAAGEKAGSTSLSSTPQRESMKQNGGWRLNLNNFPDSRHLEVACILTTAAHRVVAPRKMLRELSMTPGNSRADFVSARRTKASEGPK